MDFEIYQRRFEHFDTLVDVVVHHLDVLNKFVPIFEYKPPFEFYSRSSNGERKLSFSGSYLLSSCNSVESDDDLFESVDDLIDELDETLEDDTLSVIVNVLKEKYDCICIRKRD